MSQVAAEALHDTSLSPVLFAGGDDRRESPRVPLRHPVRVGPPNCATESMVSARDLSQHGLFVDADRPVRVGARFSVELTFSDDCRVYIPEAEVAYNREHVHGTGFGVRFIRVDPESQAMIEAEILRQTQSVLGSATLVPSVVAEAPDLVSDLPTLAPSPSLMTPTQVEAEAPEVDEPEQDELSLPPEPGLDSDLGLEASVRPHRPGLTLADRLESLRSTLARTGPGILLLAGLAIMVAGAFGLLWDGATTPTALDPAEAAVVLSDTHQHLMGEGTSAALTATADKAAPEPEADAKPAKKPLPPLVVIDESEPAAPKRLAHFRPEPANKARAAAPAPAPKAAPKAAVRSKAADKKISDKARAILGSSTKRVTVTLDPGARVLKTHVLRAPHRFVVDLVGQTSEVVAPAVSGPVLAVRSGRHPDFTRIVVDVDGAIDSGQASQDGRQLSIQIDLR